MFNEEQLLPQSVMTEIPVRGLTGLLLAGPFAAAMSSIDSGINSMTASVVCDWQSQRHSELRHSRMLCFIFGLLSVAMAVVFAAIVGDAIYLRGSEHLFCIAKTPSSVVQ